MKRFESLLAHITMPMIGVFSLALVVRVFYNVVVAAGYYPLHDSLTYQTIALNILHQHCYCLLPHLATVDRAPLWPLIIAIVYRVLGQHDIYVRLLLCVIGSGTCVLLYLFGKDLFNERVGILAGVLGAMYPFLYVYDGLLYSESIYIFLLLALCYVLYHLQRTARTYLMLTAGVLIALLTYTRPNGIALLVLFLLWSAMQGWLKTLAWRDVRKAAVVVAFVSLILIAPWSLRNYKDTHAPVLVATGDGKVLLGAYNYETADPVYQDGYYAGTWIIPTEATPWVSAMFPQTCAGPCEVQRDDAYKSAALQWVKTHPQDLPFLLSQHFMNTWQVVPQEADLAINRFPDRPASTFVVLMMETITPIIFALALLGLVVTSKRWRDLSFVYALIVVTLAECVIYYGIPRFRAPIEPIIILFASGALWWLASSVQKLYKQRVRV